VNFPFASNKRILLFNGFYFFPEGSLALKRFVAYTHQQKKDEFHAPSIKQKRDGRG
jgi:hypothetical protein